jgi:hypothetical protein
VEDAARRGTPCAVTLALVAASMAAHKATAPGRLEASRETCRTVVEARHENGSKVDTT